jgi:hypothetical protein
MEIYMEMQEKNYVSVLCYVDENWMDIGGNIFPEDGFIAAKEFTDDINIQFGLYGILWGNTDYLFYENVDDGNWAVIKVEVDNNFMFVDKMYNRVKFKNGMVVCSGNVEETGNFLWENGKDLSQCYYVPEKMKKKDIVGTKKWLKRFREKLLC